MNYEENNDIPVEDLNDPIQADDLTGNEAQTQTVTENIESSSSQDLQEMRDKYLRLMAEFENYKKRTSKERIEFAKFASQEMIVSLLPILDDFDREVKHGQVTEGSKLIHNKLAQLLKQKGLTEMQSTGEPFDASKHEAITEIPVTEDQKNKVFDTVEKGYYLSDKIIRHAKVVVGK